MFNLIFAVSRGMDHILHADLLTGAASHTALRIDHISPGTDLCAAEAEAQAADNVILRKMENLPLPAVQDKDTERYTD